MPRRGPSSECVAYQLHGVCAHPDGETVVEFRGYYYPPLRSFLGFHCKPHGCDRQGPPLDLEPKDDDGWDEIRASEARVGSVLPRKKVRMELPRPPPRVLVERVLVEKARRNVRPPRLKSCMARDDGSRPRGRSYERRRPSDREEEGGDEEEERGRRRYR